MPDQPSPMYELLLPVARRSPATLGQLAIAADEIMAAQAQRFAEMEATIAKLQSRIDELQQRELRSWARSIGVHVAG